MSQIAVSFLRRCFAPEETIAILLRKPDAPAPMQRVVRLEQALETRYMAWLSYENQHGCNNIYVAANPLRPGSRKRTKESIVSVRHLYIDIDTDGDARLATLRASELVPPPTSILSTSPGRYQVLWRVEDFDFVRQEQTLKLLAIAFGGDPACTDCNRVLRVPGFLNRKYDPPYKVVVEYPDDSVWTPDDFQLDAGAVDAMLFAVTSTPRKPPSKHSNSESDWVWVSHELAHGTDTLSRKPPQRAITLTPFSSDPLLTADDVAHRLNVSKDWVWDHSSRKRPHLPVIRMGDGTLRYRASGIEDFIRERERISALRSGHR